jgi:Flp pilus assembly protein CpaB
MRRGGALLLLIILLILVLSVAAFFLLRGGAAETAAPTPQLATIVVLAQPVPRDELIVEAMLEEIPYPEERITGSMFRKIADVADVYYAKYPLVQGQPLTSELVSERPGILQEGSDVSKTIPPGMTAISLPISRLGAVGFAIRDGDKVNVIVTTTFVDLDTSFQSLLPNSTATVTGTGFLPESLPVLTVNIASGGEGASQGRAELEPTLNQAIYMVPSEAQRPRLVSQMILQNVQVLRVGQFNLAGDQTAVSVDETQTEEGEQQQTPPPAPDIVTLIVTPQDAIALTYLIHSQARITLTLRAPDDPNYFDNIESVTLQYLISQYNIALPAKLPYGLNPRIDLLVDPLDNFFP